MWVLALTIITSATALLCTASAQAALIFPSLGQISDPEVGQPFGHLDSNSVAVNDFNNHILVADSSNGLVYDFSSKATPHPKSLTAPPPQLAPSAKGTKGALASR